MHYTSTTDMNMEIWNKTCSKGKKMNCWESFHMQVLQQDFLINEQVNEPNPLYSLVNTMKQHIT